MTTDCNEKINTLSIFNIEKNIIECNQYWDIINSFLSICNEMGEIENFICDGMEEIENFISINGLSTTNNNILSFLLSKWYYCSTYSVQLNFLVLFNAYFKNEIYKLKFCQNLLLSYDYGTLLTKHNLNNIYEGTINKKNNYQIILKIIFEDSQLFQDITIKSMDRCIQLYNLYFETFNEHHKNSNQEVIEALLFSNDKMQNSFNYATNIILSYHFLVSNFEYSINFLIKCFEIIKFNTMEIKLDYDEYLTQNKKKIIQKEINKLQQKKYEIFKYLYEYYKINTMEWNKYSRTNLIEKLIQNPRITQKNNVYLLKNTITNNNYLKNVFENMYIHNGIQNLEIDMFLKYNSVSLENLLIFTKNNFNENLYLLFKKVLKTQKNNNKLKLHENIKKNITNITFDFKNYIIIKKLKIKDYFIVDKKLSKLLNEPISKMLKIENISFI